MNHNTDIAQRCRAIPWRNTQSAIDIVRRGSMRHMGPSAAISVFSTLLVLDLDSSRFQMGRVHAAINDHTLTPSCSVCCRYSSAHLLIPPRLMDMVMETPRVMSMSMSISLYLPGGAENAGHENDGPVCWAWNCRTWNCRTWNCRTWKCRTCKGKAEN